MTLPPSSSGGVEPPDASPGRLQRRLGLTDAVALGLGGMIGTGVLVVAGPAAGVAGGLVVVSLLVAGLVAACNATSSARLAARYPVSGGAYHWGRTLLHPLAGSVAGWCFVVGKVASTAAAVLTVGLYAATVVAPGDPQALPRAVTVAVGLGIVAAVTAANVRGVRRTAAASRWLVTVVLLVLVAVVVAGWRDAGPGPDGLAGLRDAAGADAGLGGLLAGAGLFFLAFAGYARIATLGEEVRDPSRTIPRSVAVAVVTTLVLYLLVVVTAVAVLGVDGLAATTTPVADVAGAGGPWLVALVGLAGMAAAGAVALGVQAGISRVLLAMARTGELPGPLARVDPVRGTPYVADLVVGGVVAAVVLAGGIVAAAGVSAATVLLYYAVANAAALRLPGTVGRVVAATGVVGCLVLAGALVRLALP